MIFCISWNDATCCVCFLFEFKNSQKCCLHLCQVDDLPLKLRKSCNVTCLPWHCVADESWSMWHALPYCRRESSKKLVQCDTSVSNLLHMVNIGRGWCRAHSFVDSNLPTFDSCQRNEKKKKTDPKIRQIFLLNSVVIRMQNGGKLSNALEHFKANSNEHLFLRMQTTYKSNWTSPKLIVFRF